MKILVGALAIVTERGINEKRKKNLFIFAANSSVYRRSGNGKRCISIGSGVACSLIKSPQNIRKTTPDM